MNTWLGLYFHLLFHTYVERPLKFFLFLANIERETFLCHFVSLLYFVNNWIIINAILIFLAFVNSSFVLYVSLFNIISTKSFTKSSFLLCFYPFLLAYFCHPFLAKFTNNNGWDSTSESVEIYHHPDEKGKKSLFKMHACSQS